MKNQVLSISAAAEFLGVTPQTLRRWEANSSLVPIFKTTGGQRRYSKEQLQQHIAQKVANVDLQLSSDDIAVQKLLTAIISALATFYGKTVDISRVQQLFHGGTSS